MIKIDFSALVAPILLIFFLIPAHAASICQTISGLPLSVKYTSRSNTSHIEGINCYIKGSQDTFATLDPPNVLTALDDNGLLPRTLLPNTVSRANKDWSSAVSGSTILRNHLKIKYKAHLDAIQIQGSGSPRAVDGMSVARPDGAKISRKLQEYLADLPLSLKGYGAESGRDATTALQAALTDCGATGRPVFAPAGTYIFTGTSNYPTAAGQDCPGIYGEGDKTIFVVFNYNGPIIRMTIGPGPGQSGKTFANINTQGQWSSAARIYDQAALLEVTGGVAGNSPGLTYSHFKNLGGYAVHHIVKIDTEYGVISGDGQESLSGWNDFDALYGGAGSQGFRPDSYVYFTKGSSTGSTFTNFRGGAARAFLRYEGAGYVVGDVVITAGQSGTGRVISIGPKTKYNRNIEVNGTQVDANSIEVMQWDGGAIPPSRLKLTGSFGGSAPWSGLPPVAHSAVHGLGESIWSEGGRIAPSESGGGTHTAQLWLVTLAPSTMVRFETSITGLVGRVDGGGTIQTFDAACSYNNTVIVIPQTAVQIAPNSAGSAPASWPTFATTTATANGSCVVTVTATWTDGATSVLNTNITARHGTFKLQRGANVPL